MSCECNFSNKDFFAYVKELKKKHKNENYNLKQDEILKFMTMHLRDNSKLKRLILQKEIDFQEMKYLNTKCCGIINLELTGTGSYKEGKLKFYLNNKNIYLNLKTKIPNACADLSRKIIWHIHPWNVSIDHEDDVPSFFSYEDIRISVNFPGKIFIIFNMHTDNPKLPVMYLVTASKDVKKNKAKKVISSLYNDIFESLIDYNDYNVDFERMQNILKKLGVYFHYFYRYDEACLKRKLDLYM